MATAITSERTGYRRGLILGLTMAETMLLLVFCLLLVAASVVTSERKAAETARTDAERFVRENNAAAAALQRKTAEKLAEEKRSVARLEAEKIRLEEEKRLLEVRFASDSSLPAAEKVRIEKEWRELVAVRDRVVAIAKEGMTLDEASRLAPAIAILRENGFSHLNREQAAIKAQEFVTQAAQTSEVKPHQWPPIISLSEAEGYYFASGSARLTDQFRMKLDQTAGQIANLLDAYDVDVIEVIGHTDERPLSRGGSNIDVELPGVLSGTKSVDSLQPGDNAGLGLARALAVAQVLGRDPRLMGATVLPLSAAQLVLPGGHLTDGAQSGDVRERRRIEIRVRRANSRDPLEEKQP